MADGAMGFMFMAFVALVMACAGFIPLIVVAAVPVLRKSLASWVIALVIVSSDFIYLAVQIRVAAGPGGTGDLVYLGGILLSILPIVLLINRELRKIRWLCPIVLMPAAIIVPLGLHVTAFRDRSERLILAVQSGDRAEVTHLLREGADPDCFEVGHCAINAAIGRSDWKLVEQLVDYGATDAEYHEFDDIDFRRPRTSVSKLLINADRKDLATKLLANGH